MKNSGLAITGGSIASRPHAAVINPANGEVVGRMTLETGDDLDAAVAAARKAFPAWREAPSAERAAACEAVAARIEAHAEELARLLTLEQGKPLNGAGSRFEVAAAVAWTRATAGLDLPVEILPGGVALHRKPIGVVGSITPWNWPVMIACWHIVPAIRAGNTVVIKPSPQTPLSTIRLVELMSEALPPGLVNVVCGGNELGAALSAHPGIDKITFTGSTATGRKVMSSAAATLKRLTLELGGNDAGIVLPDADPAAIAEGIFWGAFSNSGQTCAALKRLYVPDSLHDAVCDALVAYAATIPMGDGLDETSLLGPLQNRAQLEIVSSFVDQARRQGGRVLIGGEPHDGPGHFYPLTLVTNVDHGCDLVDKEQFGPALPIIRYRDVDEAVAKANDSPFGLGGSVWSTDLTAARHLAGRLECGSVWLNRHGAIQPDVPFGGVKQSGLGVEFGIEGLKEFTTVQAVFG